MTFRPLVLTRLTIALVRSCFSSGLDALAADGATAERLAGSGRRALVVGCGLGDHAARVAALGFAVTAFDISETAVAWAAARHAGSAITFTTADLLQPPAAWAGAFDLVVEAMTLQTLPGDGRTRAIMELAAMVKPGGSLLLVASGRDEDEMPDWPLTEAQMARFEQAGLARVRFETVWREMAGERRRLFRTLYGKPGRGAGSGR